MSTDPLREAVTALRKLVESDRDALADCQRDPRTGAVDDPKAQAWLREYDEALVLAAAARRCSATTRRRAAAPATRRRAPGARLRSGRTATTAPGTEARLRKGNCCEDGTDSR